ncbi:MAG: hypothetical protein J2P58_03640 [Acidimicrobiaceae bacterium]|nr:hypothetical protein [Acidimicrobiaceae bacterium]
MSTTGLLDTHPLRPPGVAAAPLPRGAPAAGAPNWPSFRGTPQLAGTSQSQVSVYVDASLGAQALQNANDLLASADAVVAKNNAIFAIHGGATNVIIFALNGQTDGTGGADHGGCNFTTGNNIEVDASYGSSSRVTALFEAELSECAMNGNLCGLSTGEALSRWCAAVVSNNALVDFATAPQWAQDGMANWVDRTDQNDQSADSTGCGTAFLSWLLSQNHTLMTIAQDMVKLGDSGTLAALYATLTGDQATNAWQKFHSAIQALPAGVTSDDPFGAFPAASSAVASAVGG